MASEIKKISLEIEDKASESTQGIDSLIGKLNNLNAALDDPITKLRRLSSAFTRLATASKEINKINFTGLQSSITGLGNSLNKVNSSAKNMLGLGDQLKSMASGLNSIRRSFTSLSEVSPQITGLDTGTITNNMTTISQLSQLAQSFTQMKDGAKAFNSAVNTMDKAADKFPTMMAKINALDISKFKSQVNDLASIMKTFSDSLKESTSSVQGFSKAASELPSAITRTSSAVTKANKSIGSSSLLGKGLGILRTGFNALAIREISRALGVAIQSANDFIETINLFEVVMGSSAEKAYEFTTALQTIGVDQNQAMRFQSSFYDIGKSLGLTAENAYTLSEQFTKLSYDYASLYNLPVEEAFQKLQAGAVGTVEPLRRLGKDISQAQLEQTALNLGIEENVRDMTQAEKVQLRFITIMQQSTSAMNDMERTINSPANALRVLRAQFTSLTRELGSLFIPMITTALPYVIAFVKVLRQMAASVASFFGINAFEIDLSGLEDSLGASDTYTSDISDNLADGASNAKKIKDYMIGIDELNVLNPDTGNISTDTGAAGIGSGFELDLDMFGYDEVLKNVQSQADEILKTFEKWKPVLVGIAGVLGTLWAAGKVYNFISAVTGAGTAIAGLGKTSVLASGVKGIGALASAFFNLAGTGGILGTASTGFVVLGDTILSSMGIITGSTLVAGLTGFGAVLAVAGIAAWGLYEAMQPAIEQIDELAGVSDETRSKLEPFIETFKNLDTEIKRLDWTNAVITQQDVDSVTSKVQSLVDSILNEVDADRNQELQDIEMLKNIEGISAETYNSMIASTNEYYNDITARTQEAQSQINAIIQTAANEHRDITEEERNTITELMNQMMNDSVTIMSESAQEQEAILNRLKYNSIALTAEQGSEILKEAKANHDQQILDAQDWKARMLENLDKKFYEEGVITQEEYDKQKKAIETAYAAMEEDATTSWNNIREEVETNLGDSSKYIDTETGEMKSSWKVWWEDFEEDANNALRTWNTNWVNFTTDLGKKWNDFWGGLGTWWQEKIDGIGEWLGGIGSKFAEWKKGFQTAWDNFWGGLKAEGSGTVSINVGVAGSRGQPSGRSASAFAFASGGFVPQGASFVSPDVWTAGEAGRELIGSYQGRTTVMPLEDTGFVQAMYEAIYEATRDAYSQNEMTIIVQPKVQLDSKEIYQGQEEYRYSSGGSLVSKR